MRLRILSDLHQEFRPFDPTGVSADLIVLAGDIHTGLNGIRWAQQAFAGTPVIYVPGNHEWYGKNFNSHLERMRALAAGSNVHFLERDAFEYGGVVFLGATLWTDMALRGDVVGAIKSITYEMNDYKKIKVDPTYRKLRPHDTIFEHQTSRKWLKVQLQAHQGRPIVIVTHHAPSTQSIPQEYIDGLISPAYISNLDELVAASNARLWVHGHVHQACDYVLGGTRVLSNPRGYPEQETGFSSELVVEV